MARTINAEHVTRTDIFLVPPAQIIVDHKENTRLYKPDVSDLVEGFKTTGQLQPCLVRPLPQGLIQLVAGYRRWMAAMVIAKEQAAENIAVENRFKLACSLQKIGPDEALIANLSENADRQDLSPIENAVAIDRLRKLRGWLDSEGTEKIARIFKRSTTWVTKTEELLALSEEHRLQVHQHFITEGKQGLSLSVGQILAHVPEEKRAKVLQDAAALAAPANNIPSQAVDAVSRDSSATAKKTSVPRVKIRDVVRAAEANGVETQRRRDGKEFKEFLDGYFDGSEALHPLHPIVQELIKRQSGFFDRKFTENQIDSTLHKISDFLKQANIAVSPAQRTGAR
jgi:ParB/RepB/Spo0J family partition protein